MAQTDSECVSFYNVLTTAKSWAMRNESLDGYLPAAAVEVCTANASAVAVENNQSNFMVTTRAFVSTVVDENLCLTEIDFL